MIEAEHLTKRFRGRPAIDDVSLSVARGEVVGFLGPNGAGKTTTMRILAGVFPPTRGRATIDGCDVSRAPLAARRRVGYAPERPALYLEMTIEGFLSFVAAMKDVPAGAPRRRTVASAMERSGLGHERATRLGVLSKGYRQRVGLALALVGDPPALLLDEPTAGLDPEQSAETRRLIRDLGRDHAVLVSSHALAEVETLSDRVVILHRGRVLAADRPAALAARLPTSRLAVEANAPAAALARALAAVPGVRRVDPASDTPVRGDAASPERARVIVEQEPGHDVRPALAATVVGHGWGLLALAAVDTSLEDAFLALVAEREGSPRDRAARGRDAE